MFCFQCEQTSKGEGCTKIGVCGKKPEVAALQDLLVYALKGLSQYAVEGRKVGVSDPEVDRFTSKALFSTLTNVDFDPARFVELINETVKHREVLKEKVRSAGGKTGFTQGPAVFKPESSLEAMVNQGEKVVSSRTLISIPTYCHSRNFWFTGSRARSPTPTMPPSWGRRTKGCTLLRTKLWRPPWTARSVSKKWSAWCRSAVRSTFGPWSYWMRPIPALPATRFPPRFLWALRRQGHSRVRARSQRPGVASAADRWKRDQCLHPW